MSNALWACHARLSCSLRDIDFLCHCYRICAGMPEDMSLLDFILGVSLATGLTAYLIYALIRPEKF